MIMVAVLLENGISSQIGQSKVHNNILAAEHHRSAAPRRERMHKITGRYNVNGRFAEGPPGTIITAEWLNAIQDEIVSVIEEAGLALNLSSNDSGNQLLNAITSISKIPSGVTIPFAGTSIPSGWLYCDGFAVSRATYLELYQAIGVVWGSGDGATTFNIPNMEGLLPKGVGDATINARSKVGPATLGEVQEDQLQGHVMYQGYKPLGAASDSRYGFGTGLPSASIYTEADDSISPTASTTAPKTSTPQTDGVNGTPRTGSYTRDSSVGFYYIIKI
jgi:microcystin-dependent protein